MARCAMTAMAVLVLVAMLSYGSPVGAQPANVTIESVSYMGSGCNWSNTAYVLSPNYTTVTILFGGMIATTDAGLAGMRKNCVISLGLNYPTGWSFAMGKVTARGYAKLDAGVQGTYQTSYFISGQTGTAYAKRKLHGKLELNYESTDDFGLLVWSQCGSISNLNVNVEVRVDGPKGHNGIMTVDSTDKKFELKYYLHWTPC